MWAFALCIQSLTTAGSLQTKLKATCWRMKPLPVWSVPLCVVLTLASWCAWLALGRRGAVGVLCASVCVWKCVWCGVCDVECNVVMVSHSKGATVISLRWVEFCNSTELHVHSRRILHAHWQQPCDSDGSDSENPRHVKHPPPHQQQLMTFTTDP